LLAEHNHGERRACSGADLQDEFGAFGAQPDRPQRETDPRAARNAIDRVVDERDLGGAEHLRAHRAAQPALVAADLEEVGEVRVELERQREPRGSLGIARHRKELVAARLPQELGARDVERVLGEPQLLANEDVRVGEVHVEDDVVGLHGRRQHERLAPLEGEVQARQEARVVVEHALRAVLHLEHVAEFIEHREAVAMLERAPAGRRDRDYARDEDRADYLLLHRRSSVLRPSLRYTAR
jgi:hypothetical protein